MCKDDIKIGSRRVRYYSYTIMIDSNTNGEHATEKALCNFLGSASVFELDTTCLPLFHGRHKLAWK